MKSIVRLAAAAVALAAAMAAHANEVSVAVAANFAAPLDKIAQGFTKATGIAVKSSAGATGKFYSQITAGGAPFEVLLSADDETPMKLVKEGFAVSGTEYTYAIGQLVLWSAKPDLVDAKGAVLKTDKFAKIAVANPKTAPYGRAAMETLQSMGLTAAVTPRIVTGDSIGQAFQFVSSGNADLGFVALSQVIAEANKGAKPAAADASAPAPAATPALPGSTWPVPHKLYGQIRQDAVLLKPGEQSTAAKAFLSYLKSDAAQAVIRSFGYEH